MRFSGIDVAELNVGSGLDRSVEYRGYQINVGVYDLAGFGFSATIEPLTDTAALADRLAQVSKVDNLILMKAPETFSADSGNEDLRNEALIDLGLRAAMIEIDCRLGRLGEPKTEVRS